MQIKGTVYKFGNDVDTDQIIPARYLNTTEPLELAAHCMEDADPEFAAAVQPGAVMVAGKNFGCGSSREHAPIAIKAAGVSCVIASTFARIFYRNAVNIGLPILECPEAAAALEEGDQVVIDLVEGVIRNLTRPGEYQSAPFPSFMQEIIKQGGLINYVQERMKEHA
ncbi:MAG: 3-isopropylmalate dehydratase small subunit [Syntrophaceticus schinkii]|nr:3-isopropylmalate dehydratase small subunit [Syntrophaceticus schinkii]